MPVLADRRTNTPSGTHPDWACIDPARPDPIDLHRRLTAGAIGGRLAAAALSEPSAVEHLAPLLQLCQEQDAPVLVTESAGPGHRAGSPAWWSAVVDEPAALSRAWWTWTAAGRPRFPTLRICFAAGAGLAPLAHERFTTAGGGPLRLDRFTFVDAGSFGPRAVDALIRVLGIDAVLYEPGPAGARPVDLGLGAAADHALRIANPIRFRHGGQP